MIDLYQIHWPNPVVPIAQQMEGMRRLQRRRRRRRTSASATSRWRGGRRAEAALGSPVLSNQVQYSLVARKPDAELVPYAQAQRSARHRVQPARHGPARRAATTPTTRRPDRRGSTTRCSCPRTSSRRTPLIDAVRAVANAHDATPAQVALAWVISHPNVVAIPGASSVAQLEANVAAADLDSSADEIARAHRRRPTRTPRRAVAGVGARSRLATAVEVGTSTCAPW